MTARVDEGRWAVAEEVASRYFDRSDDEWGHLRTDVAEALAGNITGAARVDENPYMLADTPEELERVSRIAAERHREEAARIDAGAAAVERPPGTIWNATCGAQVETGRGVATCTDHGLGHYDPAMGLSWPAGEGPLVTRAEPSR